MNPAAATVAPLAPTASLHRFDAYRLALAFRAHVVRWLPLKRSELSDQLDRASLSIALNIAEGAGRSGPRDQARHYAIARGSAFECLAVLDLLELENAPPSSRDARVILLRLMAILTTLVRR
jgi:four helix bundle protein